MPLSCSLRHVHPAGWESLAAIAEISCRFRMTARARLKPPQSLSRANMTVGWTRSSTARKWGPIQKLLRRWRRSIACHREDIRAWSFARNDGTPIDVKLAASHIGHGVGGINQFLIRGLNWLRRYEPVVRSGWASVYQNERGIIWAITESTAKHVQDQKVEGVKISLDNSSGAGALAPWPDGDGWGSSMWA